MLNMNVKFGFFPIIIIIIIIIVIIIIIIIIIIINQFNSDSNLATSIWYWTATSSLRYHMLITLRKILDVPRRHAFCRGRGKTRNGK